MQHPKAGRWWGRAGGDGDGGGEAGEGSGCDDTNGMQSLNMGSVRCLSSRRLQSVWRLVHSVILKATYDGCSPSAKPYRWASWQTNLTDRAAHMTYQACGRVSTAAFQSGLIPHLIGGATARLRMSMIAGGHWNTASLKATCVENGSETWLGLPDHVCAGGI